MTFFRRKRGPSGADEAEQVSRPAEQTPVANGSLLEQLIQSLLKYGATNDEHMVDGITALYLRANTEVPPNDRMDTLLSSINLVEERRTSGNILMPFIFRDTDWQI